MKVNKIFVTNQQDKRQAIQKTTHMCIAAHQDDIEIMAYHGIEACFQSETNHFFGVVVTNGSGSSRSGIYKNYTDQEMMQVRRKEQIKAAQLGEYSALAMLDYPSKMVKDPSNLDVIHELVELITIASPKYLYTHNLADKHDTHVAVVLKVIEALRKIPKEHRPEFVYGCEVWRDLDWVNDDEKVYLDVSNHENLASSLVEVFDSQVIGGKRYDKATLGRRLANATFSSSHNVDQSNALSYAIDLTPLIEDDTLNISSYIEGFIDRFKSEVLKNIEKMKVR